MKDDLVEKCITYIFSIPLALIKPSYTKDVIESYLRRTFSEEIVQAFFKLEFKIFLSEFVNEYNYKLEQKLPVCFSIADEYGERISPMQTVDNSLLVAEAFITLTPAELEIFACRILLELGCSKVYLTPASHDQGLDGFGYISSNINSRVFEEVLVFIQAKHYEEDISSINIREYVGSVELARDKIWALLKDRYPQLKVKKYTPFRLVYLTSGHIKRTTKILCESAGIDILCRDDLTQMYPELNCNTTLKEIIDDTGKKLNKILA